MFDIFDWELKRFAGIEHEERRLVNAMKIAWMEMD